MSFQPSTQDTSAAAADGTQPAAPFLTVIKGEPTPEELAALAAVVASLSAPASEAPRQPSTRHWVRRQQLRLSPTPGPGAWKRSRG